MSKTAARGAVVLGLLVWGSLAHAAPRRARFDVMTYQAPAGWKVRKDGGVLFLRAANEKAGAFALVSVQPSTASAGSLDGDFQAAWQRHAVAGFQVSAPPDMTPAEPENGWQATSGTATGSAAGVEATVIVVTMTGHGRTTSMVVVCNDVSGYGPALDQLLSSVKLDARPPTLAADRPAPPAVPSPAPPAPPSTDTAGAPAPAAGGAPTTTFDDGWTARVAADWVEVTRGALRVRLHHAIAYDDASRANTVGYFWARLIASRYAVSNAALEAGSPYVSLPFGQADAIDTATRQPGFVAMVVVSESGVAYVVEAFAPSRAAFAQEIGDASKLAAMRAANRFAVSGDVVGTWSDSNTSVIDAYNVATGTYAGMNAAASASSFWFGPKGAFKSEHKGATGMVGSMKFYQQSYAGTWRASSPWELTIKRNDGKTLVYVAQLEAVRGGWVLRMYDKQAPGMKYALVRTGR